MPERLPSEIVERAITRYNEFELCGADREPMRAALEEVWPWEQLARAEKRVIDAAVLFGVTDGGRYWNDWLSRQRTMETELAEAQQETERLTGKLKGVQFDLELQTADAKKAREERDKADAAMNGLAATLSVEVEANQALRAEIKHLRRELDYLVTGKDA